MPDETTPAPTNGIPRQTAVHYVGATLLVALAVHGGLAVMGSWLPPQDWTTVNSLAEGLKTIEATCVGGLLGLIQAGRSG